MKKSLFNPGFEMIFALSLVAVLAIPPLVMAQNASEFKFTIINGDTTINGKNTKDMSAAEHSAALKELNASGITFNADASGHQTLTVKAGKKAQGSRVLVESLGSAGNRDMVDGPINMAFRLSSDSDAVVALDTARILASTATAVKTFGHYNFNQDMPHIYNYSSTRNSLTGFNRKNTQSFIYTSVDNDGISSHVSYSVGDANAEILKRITGAEKADLLITDLNLAPSFSTGKTTLSFTFNEKGSAGIEFKNTEGKTLWAEKTSSTTFSKNFELPQNGVYYLVVKQAGKVALRKVVKEQLLVIGLLSY